MKTMNIKKTLLLAIGGVFVWWAWKSPAQDTSGATASMEMPPAVTQVLELEQAKIGDPTVIAFIKSSGTSYNLNASQIVFLRQEGVSDAVITAMLTQPRTDGPSVNTQAPEPAPQPIVAPTTATPSDPPIVSQPPVTYVQNVQTAPASYDYSYSYPYPYYTCYGWAGWPFGWGWYGGAWHWGWGWHGGAVGWHGGWGGGWHGRWGGHGGGWHH